VPAITADGTAERAVGEVAELTPYVDLTGWPPGSRLLVRREIPHPGAQLAFTDIHGYRYQLTLTNLPDPDIAVVEALHRGRGRCEPVIRDLKATGLAPLPSADFATNPAWLTAVCLAGDLLAWFRGVCLPERWRQTSAWKRPQVGVANAAGSRRIPGSRRRKADRPPCSPVGRAAVDVSSSGPFRYPLTAPHGAVESDYRKSWANAGDRRILDADARSRNDLGERDSNGSVTGGDRGAVRSVRSIETKAATGVRAVVLGAAQDGGLPQVGCGCAHCRDARAGRMRRERASSIAIVDDGRRVFWLLDAGPDFPDQYDALVAETGPGYTLAGVVITHAHIGHYLGLVHLGREVMGLAGVPIVATARLCDFLRQNGPFAQLVRLENIRLVPTPPDTLRPLTPDVAVELMPVPHRQEFSDTVAVRVKGPNRSLLYLPDIDAWALWERSLAKTVAQVDIALLDGTFYDAAELPGRERAEIPHPPVVETVAALGTGGGKVYFTHLNHSNRLWEAGAEADLRRLGFLVAHRGQQHPL
jgi:pyrroloquinoline quinone biosynthesis protein B